MKLSDLIKQANRDVDDSFPTADVTEWLNRALDDLTPVAKKQAKVTINLNATNSYPLPDDLHEIALVVVGSYTYRFPLAQEDLSSQGFKVWADELSLQQGPTSGTLELYYYKKLTHLVNSDDVPEIEPEYQDLLILYASALSQYSDEEPEDEQDAFNRYFQRKAEYDKYIKRKRRTGRVRMVH